MVFIHIMFMGFALLYINSCYWMKFSVNPYSSLTFTCSPYWGIQSCHVNIYVRYFWTFQFLSVNGFASFRRSFTENFHYLFFLILFLITIMNYFSSGLQSWVVPTPLKVDAPFNQPTHQPTSYLIWLLPYHLEVFRHFRIAYRQWQIDSASANFISSSISLFVRIFLIFEFFLPFLHIIVERYY
jgi:hypothetical protein